MTIAKTLVIVAAVSLMPFTASAQQGAQKMMMGPGVSTCGAWVANRKTSRSSLASAWAEFWLLGYLSRASFQHQGDILGGTDSQGLFAWVDKYCAENPLDLVVDAADQLEAELAAKARPPTRRK